MNIPIENLYFLLCYSWNKLEEKNIVQVDYNNNIDLLNLFAKVLASGLQYLNKKGLDKDYVDINEDSRVLKGKLNIQESVKRNLLQKAHVNIDYNEFSDNVLHNQILKSTIRSLLSYHDIDNKIKDLLFPFYKKLYYVNEIRIVKNDFKRIHLHRNNRFYGFLLNICEIIYDSSLINENDGQIKFKDFSEDETKMRIIFEEFVRNFYKIEQKTYKVKRENIKYDVTALDEQSLNYLPIMQTDISLESSSRKIIIDTKFYKEALRLNRFGKYTLHSSNLYQMAEYLRNIEMCGGLNANCEGILLYPTVNYHLNLNYEMKGHNISIRTINLNQNWTEIHKDLLALIDVS